MGTKSARFHPRRVIFTTDPDKTVEPAFSLVRRRRAGEARPHARAGVGGQGELADQQQAATGITQRPVHLPGLIGEHPVAQQALGHPLQLGLGIAGLHADQRQQAGADLPDRFVVDMHGGLADTLDQDEHRGLPNEQGRPR
ncbi:hypothetical protein G6F32_014176 [Rhizopus arrhizus]|nr:hypothetical protein G6F32_014176 [Rhizopus arrhizus]